MVTRIPGKCNKDDELSKEIYRLFLKLTRDFFNNEIDISSVAIVIGNDLTYEREIFLNDKRHASFPYIQD